MVVKLPVFWILPIYVTTPQAANIVVAISQCAYPLCRRLIVPATILEMTRLPDPLAEITMLLLESKHVPSTFSVAAPACPNLASEAAGTLKKAFLLAA